MEGAAVYMVALFVGGGVGRAGVLPRREGGLRLSPSFPEVDQGQGFFLHHKGPQGGEGSELTTRNRLLQADVREVEGRL